MRAATESASRRALLSLCSALLATPTPSPAAAAAAAAAARGLQTFDIAASDLDRRSFRGMQLSNGLRVLLCSDPEAGKAAASMNVAVGSMSNPVEWPGLAHFCEHMLFLGTKRFPGEGEFERFIAANAGSNNAFTGSEETNYFFSVNGDALPGALTRFADFFTAPLFSESGTTREVDAIDAEHAKNLQSDFWRSDAVLRLRARPDHPYSRFFTGNRQTLRGGDADARAALFAFHRAFYRAPQMALAVAGPQSLDALQRLVQANFGALPPGPAPPASAAYDALPPPFDTQPQAEPPVATVLVPVREQRSVTVTWCLPVEDPDEWWRAKPDSTVLLKAKGLASSVDGSIDEFTRSFVVLTAYIGLTPQGLQRWPEVVSALFSYLALLREEGVPPHVYAEERRMRELAFAFAEPAPPSSFVQSASGNLFLFPPREWLRGPLLAGEGAEPLVRSILEGLTPQAAVVKLTARELAPLATRVEPVYSASYGEMPIGREVAAWSAAPRLDGLAVPPPNRFIPTDLSIKALSIKARGASTAQGGGGAARRVKPALLLNTDSDERFGRPKAFAFVSLRTPQLYESAAAAAQAELYAALLSDALQDVTYQAARAGLSAGASVGWQGLSLSLSGYDQRLPELAALVADSLRTFDVAPLAFERQRDGLLRQLRGADKRQPVEQAAYRRNLALETPRYTNEQLAAGLEKATLPQVLGLQRRLLPEVEVEALLCGNVAEGQATQLVLKLLNALGSRPLPVARRPVRRVRVLPAGERTLQQFVAASQAEVNSATEVYFQVGGDEADDWVLLTLLSQLMQQLGYIVQCSANEIDGVRGLSFLVQSKVAAPEAVEERIEAFLRLFRGTLLLLGEAEVQSYAASIAAQFTDAGRLWAECTRRRYDFERPWRSAEKVKRLTREQLIAFFDRHVASGSPTRRQLSTHVYAQSMAPPQLRVQLPGDDFYPAPRDLLLV
ncbi:peptidase M16 [Emiliania huxleyi CCMP1516]|uniref:Uncharacterized protein n=2 Tax=Emiliania huxleyi TaxID=2903 RepID=A0A0D3KRL6_EMIH1|nr:peptidase M16 [Emiliania huxleyi CCMP1516]EOD38401.1 peptidase M16 [Emiliania huxleyi CCMP1516]|eukprot:XP_005790830.1 peptidase M16 [Emiliania huxleyi CCMP1516]